MTKPSTFYTLRYYLALWHIKCHTVKILSKRDILFCHVLKYNVKFQRKVTNCSIIPTVLNIVTSVQCTSIFLHSLHVKQLQSLDKNSGQSKWVVKIQNSVKFLRNSYGKLWIMFDRSGSFGIEMFLSLLATKICYKTLTWSSRSHLTRLWQIVK